MRIAKTSLVTPRKNWKSLISKDVCVKIMKIHGTIKIALYILLLRNKLFQSYIA